MIADLLYRCPACGAFNWLRESQCIHCGSTVDVHSRTEISVNGQRRNISHWYQQVMSFALPLTDKGIILESKKIRVAKEVASCLFKGYEGVTATHYIREPIDEGVLTLFDNRLVFSGSDEKNIPFELVTSVTIESNTVIVVSRKYGPLFFDFLEESGKKWEDCIRKAIAEYHNPKKILEYYPRIRFSGEAWRESQTSAGPKRLKVAKRKWYWKNSSIFFKSVRVIARNIVKMIFSVRIDGLENIPKKGPAIMVSNHLSFLDAIILGMFFPRNIWFMAKNSQFYNSFLFWFLRISGAFPVRRYTIDGQAVRNVIRILDAGHIIGIFPEGERSWDGRMLPFKYGCQRLILALNYPVIPVGISGAYELMPRWTAKIKRVPVRVNIGAPVKFEHIPVSMQTEEKIQEASNQLRAYIVGLMDDNQKN
jgi:1-acyl-sn-glycerol-3-phosphate acyltransferase